MHKGQILIAAAAMSLAFVALSDATDAADAAPSYVDAAIHDPGRAVWDVTRDGLRKPAEVIAFSQIKPGMVVVDLVPGDGYYTRILSKLVGPKGKVYAVVPGGGGAGARGARMQQRDRKFPAAVPAEQAEVCAIGCYDSGTPPAVVPVDQVLALMNLKEFANLTVLWEDVSSFGGDLSIPEQADVVFSAGGYHELHFKAAIQMPEEAAGRGANVTKPVDMAGLTKSAFNTIKPGGLFVVLDHAAAKGAGFSQADKLHRIEADAVKAELLAAGFTLDGESSALAKPNDNHTTPASGAFATRDAADQFLFRFKKPVNAPSADKRPTTAQEAEIMKAYYGNTFIARVGMKKANPLTGERLRHHFYNPDHTYQEFGRLSDGPGAFQGGTWYWDADGHNCMLHQYPADERQNVVCHTDVVLTSKLPLNVITDGRYGGHPAKLMLAKGHVYPD